MGPQQRYPLGHIKEWAECITNYLKNGIFEIEDCEQLIWVCNTRLDQIVRIQPKGLTFTDYYVEMEAYILDHDD